MALEAFAEIWGKHNENLDNYQKYLYNQIKKGDKEAIRALTAHMPIVLSTEERKKIEKQMAYELEKIYLWFLREEVDYNRKFIEEVEPKEILVRENGEIWTIYSM